MCLCMEVILVYFLKYSGKSMRFSAIFVGYGISSMLGVDVNGNKAYIYQRDRM